jgi:hypothetical protein
MTRPLRIAPHLALRAWLTANKATQTRLIALMKAEDSTVPMSNAKLSKILSKSEKPTEHQRLVLQRVTGIREDAWLPPRLRRLRREMASTIA